MPNTTPIMAFKDRLVEEEIIGTMVGVKLGTMLGDGLGASARTMSCNFVLLLVELVVRGNEQGQKRL